MGDAPECLQYLEEDAKDALVKHMRTSLTSAEPSAEATEHLKKTLRDEHMLEDEDAEFGSLYDGSGQVGNRRFPAHGNARASGYERRSKQLRHAKWQEKQKIPEKDAL